MKAYAIFALIFGVPCCWGATEVTKSQDFYDFGIFHSSPLYVGDKGGKTSRQIEREITEGELLKAFVTLMPDGKKLIGNVTATVKIVAGADKDQNGVLSGSLYCKTHDASIAESYRKLVSRYVDLRAEGFTVGYAIELLIDNTRESHPKQLREISYIVSKYPDVLANRLQLIETNGKSHGGELKTYRMVDGNYAWYYEVAIEADGKISGAFEYRKPTEDAKGHGK